MTSTELARAKVNLFLHVGPPGADGYHEISSLMVFADIGDRVTLRPGESGFAVTGPFAAELTDGGDNLVVRARDRFRARYPRGADFGLTLDKTLPIAAGLGGGSADAAAVLRLMARIRDIPEADRNESGALGEIARGLGADVVACLGSKAVVAEGRGDILTSFPVLPVLHGVLVNPGLPSSTAAVYRALDADGAWGQTTAHPFNRPTTAKQMVPWLETTRNDLEAPATRLCPQILDVLALLRASDSCLFARMSGSGATCFALCADEAEAARLAGDLSAKRPGWWVTPCRFGSGMV